MNEREIAEQKERERNEEAGARLKKTQREVATLEPHLREWYWELEDLNVDKAFDDLDDAMNAFAEAFRNHEHKVAARGAAVAIVDLKDNAQLYIRGSDDGPTLHVALFEDFEECSINVRLETLFKQAVQVYDDVETVFVEIEQALAAAKDYAAKR